MDDEELEKELLMNSAKAAGLNPRLVIKQGIGQLEISKLSVLHDVAEKLKSDRGSTDVDVEYMAKLGHDMQEVEFMMQEQWGFEKDYRHHTHGYHLKGCECAYISGHEAVAGAQKYSACCAYHAAFAKPGN